MTDIEPEETFILTDLQITSSYKEQRHNCIAGARNEYSKNPVDVTVFQGTHI